MDVRGVALDRVRKDGVDQPHQRLTVLTRLRLHAGGVDLAGLDLVQDAVDGELVAVETVDGGVDLDFAGQQRAQIDVAADLRAHTVQRDEVERIRHGEGEHALAGAVADRDHAVTPRLRLRQQRERVAVGHGMGEVDALLAERLADLFAHDRLGHEAESDEDAPERLGGVFLLGQGDA
jgi:hypothetical protein